MAVRIRLKRMGSKKKPFYRMVVAEESAPRDGRYIEELGYYNPLTKEMKLDNELAREWIKKGAQPSDTAKALLTKNGAFGDVVRTEKPAVKKLSKKAKAKAEAAANQSAGEETGGNTGE